MKETSRRARVLTALLFAGMGVASASTAYAIGGGSWYSSSSPLMVYNGGSKAGFAYGTFKGYEESPTSGSVLTNVSYHRAVGTSTNYRDGAYVESVWWSNGQSCYISYYDAQGGAGISCNDGWNQKWTKESARSRFTNTYTLTSQSWRIDPSGSSGRVGVRVCIDIPWAYDVCSGTIYRGSDY